MKRYAMFIDWKIQYFPDINHYQIDEGNQCNTNQYLHFFLDEKPEDHKVISQEYIPNK